MVIYYEVLIDNEMMDIVDDVGVWCLNHHVAVGSFSKTKSCCNR